MDAYNSACSDGPSFYLIPANTAAEKVINDRNNKHLVEEKDGRPSLHLTFPDPTNNIITLGRANADVTIPDSHGAHINRLHAYFQYNVSTGAVVLCDKSQNGSTQVYDPEEDCIVPISKVMNSVVFTRGFNRNITIGHRRHYKFKVIWAAGNDAVRSFLSAYPNHFGPARNNFDPNKVRYLQGEVLGIGGFGVVWKTINIHDGSAMAVKRFYSLEGKGHVMAIREVNNMLKLSANSMRKHEHILHVLDVEYDKDTYKWIEVFMPLMDGSVKSLFDSHERVLTDAEIGNDVLYQMAKALKYTAKYKLVHRDVKPDNILYRCRVDDEGQVVDYHFFLADFGLSNESASARTRAGTPMFMAPEVYNREPQSCSTDIWSLFVTVAWIYDVNDFRSFDSDDPTELLHKILEAAANPLLVNIKDMAEVNPRLRVSARDLVARLEESGMGVVHDASGLGSQMSAMSLDGDTVGNEDYVPSIPGEAIAGFRRVHGNALQSAGRPRGNMDGVSGLSQFGSRADDLRGGPSRTGAYQAGRVGPDYRRHREPRVIAQEAEFGGDHGADEEEVGDEGLEEGDGTGDAYLRGHYLYTNN